MQLIEQRKIFYWEVCQSKFEYKIWLQSNNQARNWPDPEGRFQLKLIFKPVVNWNLTKTVDYFGNFAWIRNTLNTKDLKTSYSDQAKLG